ncbi:hypothetical protein OG21DRAFT_373468 [Imleria badia]|nr:hypothetical protein OG21DRAFT_373468 [Imleria badia]
MVFVGIDSLSLPQSVAFLLESPRLRRQEISKLRHPTQFIGLDRIHSHLSSDVKPFINKPFLSARIDESSPDKSFFDVDQRSYMTSIGTVFPAHHRVMATPTVSTILQFRAVDYGMEACELMISLPARHEAAEVTGEPSFVASDLPITIHLSQLDMSSPLDGETISYRTQPRPLREIAEFSIRNLPATFSHNFTCKMEEVLTFKVGCQSPECHVEWWQDIEYPGITLRQHALL